MAASGGIIITPLPGDSCKYPGQSTGFSWGYKMFFQIETSVATTFCVSSVTVPNLDPSEVKIFSVNGDSSSPYCTNLAVGLNTINIIVGSANSANGTGTFTYSLSDGATGTFTATFGDFPPCKRD